MRYKAIAFDIDGTISSHISSWQLIHERPGIWSGNAETYQRKFLAGEISYREFCELNAAKWKGEATVLRSLLCSELPPVP